MDLELAATFFLGLFSALFLLVISMRVQEVIRRFDELCQIIREAADLGVSYWVSESENDKVSNEALIIGHQQLINLTLNSLASRFNKSKQQEWVGSLEPFIDALTGGDFGERELKQEPNRAQQIQAEMALLIDKIRNYQKSTLGYCKIFYYIF